MKRAHAAAGVLAAVLVLVLLVLAVQQHHHANGERASCVACIVHVQRATPAETQPRLAPPVLVALDRIVEPDGHPSSRTAPIPRAQGPPAAA